MGNFWGEGDVAGCNFNHNLRLLPPHPQPDLVPDRTGPAVVAEASWVPL